MEILELMDAMSILIACKGSYKYLSKNQRIVYDEALERVQKHGTKLFDDAVVQKDYEDLQMRVRNFELMHPSVVK